MSVPTPDPEAVRFRSLAAPGLDEDEIFAALHGLAGEGLLWGAGMPTAFGPAEAGHDEEAERRRRHEEALRRWAPIAE